MVDAVALPWHSVSPIVLRIYVYGSPLDRSRTMPGRFPKSLHSLVVAITRKHGRPDQEAHRSMNGRPSMTRGRRGIGQVNNLFRKRQKVGRLYGVRKQRYNLDDVLLAWEWMDDYQERFVVQRHSGKTD